MIGWMWLACGGTDPVLQAQREALTTFDQGVALMGSGRAIEARAKFAEIRTTFDHPAVAAWEARAAAAAGDLQAATALLEAALAADPTMAEARYNLAAYLARQGKPELAGPHLDRALQEGVADPLEVLADRDFEPHRGHPAFAFLPASALTATLTPPPPVAFLGSEFTVAVRLTGLVSPPVRVTAEEASGPVRLVSVLEAPEGRALDLTWTLKVTGPGTIVLGPLRFDAAGHEATVEGIRIEASAPPGTPVPEEAPPTFPVPSTVAAAIEGTTAVRRGDQIAIRAELSDTVATYPPQEEPSIRLIRREQGRDLWVVHLYEQVGAVVGVAVLAPDGSVRWEGAPLVVGTEGHR